MKFLFAFLLGLCGISAVAQDRWKISLDKKVLLTTSVEDEAKNVVRITAADLKKSQSFIIRYEEATPQKGWERTIVICDEKDMDLKKGTGKKMVLAIADFNKLPEQSKTLKIYTINSPLDPKLKAQVRLRRVHLCTLVLQ